MMKKYLFYLVVLPPFMALIFISFHVGYLLNRPYTTTEVEFTVKPGESFASINHNLSQQNIINNSRVFYYYVKYKNYFTKFKTGTYLITQGLNMMEVAEVLVHGSPLVGEVTIPEGKNIFEIAKILEAARIVKAEAFLSKARDKNFLKKIGIASKFNVSSAEGFLFPETYRFNINSSPEVVIANLYNVFKNKTRDLDFRNELGLNFLEVITLASMVEKETGAAFERPKIAGVFYNRLKKKMRLQSDPTTIYGIYERYDGNLHKEDLLTTTPYNTYKISALPIGPICNPSLEAIKAALNPESSNYLFFVSHNDGTHFFSDTYKKHVEAVNNFQKNAKNREGKSWRDLNRN
ncbi:MAG: endolytic transglycosylase MltG [Bacteriovoracaceae bacterium]